MITTEIDDSGKLVLKEFYETGVPPEIIWVETIEEAYDLLNKTVEFIKLKEGANDDSTKE